MSLNLPSLLLYPDSRTQCGVPLLIARLLLGRDERPPHGTSNFQVSVDLLSPVLYIWLVGHLNTRLNPV